MFKKRQEPRVSGTRTAVIAALLIGAGMTSAATINVQVVTDKSIYKIGDTVYWTVYAWASKGDNRGVALLSADMEEDTADTLQLPSIAGGEFAGTAYGTEEKFVKFVDPVLSQVSPELRGILVMQLPNDRRLDIGNDGRTDHILVQGSYTIVEHGWHTLSVILNAANYWPDSVNLMAAAFETINSSPARFRVGLDGDINGDYCVNMLDFSVLAAWWAGSQCDATPYCDGADVTGDGVVDLSDAAVVVGQWLWCDRPDQAGLEADINKDRYVNMLDFSVLAEWWAGSTCNIMPYCDGADVATDGVVDLSDATLFAAQWLWCDDPGNPACAAF